MVRWNFIFKNQPLGESIERKRLYGHIELRGYCFAVRFRKGYMFYMNVTTESVCGQNIYSSVKIKRTMMTQ